MKNQTNQEDELLEALFNNIPINRIPLSENEFENYQKWQYELDLPEISKDIVFTNEFFIDEHFKNLTDEEILEILFEKCNNDKEIERVVEEFTIFYKLNRIDLIRYFMQLVDQMKLYNVVWGVGRGSSVSIFIFYLIGLHKVNSVKYNLDYRDFFKTQE